MIAVFGGRGKVAAPPYIFLECLFGVVWGVFWVFGGVFWLLLGVVWYCMATGLLGGWFPGCFGVVFGVWRCFWGWGVWVEN